jgi:uncharacterized protein (DUF302 family)
MEKLDFTVPLTCDYEEAIVRTTEKLQEQGFGVLTRIDIHNALREKIGVEFRRYTILGACNPPLAHKALQAVPEVGLMLPCNVTVEEAEGGALVRIINPREMMNMGGFGAATGLREVADEAYTRLEKVAKALAV